MSFNEDDNRRDPRRPNNDRMRRFGRNDRPRFNENRFSSRGFQDRESTPAARPDNVVAAIGDADAAPQVAVGGIKEVEELLNKDPMRVHRILFMHQSGNPKLYNLQKLAKRAHVHVQQVDYFLNSFYFLLKHSGFTALC